MNTHQDKVAIITGNDARFATGQTLVVDSGLARL